MKNALLWFIGTLVVIAVFADGGLEVSPTVSPEFSPSFEFAPNVQYSPDRSVTNIDTNIEHQTVIVQPLTPSYQWNGQTSLSATTVDPPYRECDPLPGETIYEGPDGRGGCKVVDEQGNRFFINPAGSRWPLESGGGAIQQWVEANQQQQALQPATEPTVEQMQAAYLRNGGRLPLTWSWFGEERKRRFLASQAETWK
jgi:hypothetical protein